MQRMHAHDIAPVCTLCVAACMWGGAASRCVYPNLNWFSTFLITTSCLHVFQTERLFVKCAEGGVRTGPCTAAMLFLVVSCGDDLNDIPIQTLGETDQDLCFNLLKIQNYRKKSC
ncbi:hypothetical protein XENOCAPTIV_023815 [Xenoophorus captivus]|uniref:Secreted protein n=1 Tax=Xenoophorus captivus TaxID=1517983 RepID=A0ABV0Q6W7_9TELE